MSNVRHVLGISGGKDSAALAIYLNDKYPNLNIEYYFCETDKELDETYKLLENIEIYLGKKILRLKAAIDSPEDQFDHFLKLYGNYLPSATARWCTRTMKLVPFENFIGEDPTISYVGIRGDENRDGYISHKENIQSIFPFRKNIWSKEIVHQVLINKNLVLLEDISVAVIPGEKKDTFFKNLKEKLSFKYDLDRKLNDLLTVSISNFNKVIFNFLKTTDYPIGLIEDFPMLENEDVLVRDDIFTCLPGSRCPWKGSNRSRTWKRRLSSRRTTGIFSIRVLHFICAGRVASGAGWMPGSPTPWWWKPIRATPPPERR